MPPTVEYGRSLLDGIDHLDDQGFLTSLYFVNFHSLILIILMYCLALKNWVIATKTTGISEASPLKTAIFTSFQPLFW